MFAIAFLILSLISFIALFIVVFQIVRYALRRINVWRTNNGKKPFNERLCFFLSLFSALAIVI